LKEDLRQIPSINAVVFPSFEEINTRVKSIVEQQILASDKIEELVHNAMAHKWVEEGCELHKDRGICYFCGGIIANSRWATLERHYDEATKDLKTRIEKAITWMNEKIQIAQELYKVSSSNYYSCFENEVEVINKDMDALRKDLISALEGILQQLKSKQESIHSAFSYTEHTFDFTAIEAIYQRIQNLNKSANLYGGNLSEVQAENRRKLRLSEVARFKEEIGYSNTLTAIKEKRISLVNRKLSKSRKNRIFVDLNTKSKPRNVFAKTKRKEQEG
jgi:hypothetical protein